MGKKSVAIVVLVLIILGLVLFIVKIKKAEAPIFDSDMAINKI